MAGAETDEIRRDVPSTVEDVINSPRFRSLVTDMVENQAGSAQHDGNASCNSSGFQENNHANVNINMPQPTSSRVTGRTQLTPNHHQVQVNDEKVCLA